MAHPSAPARTNGFARSSIKATALLLLLVSTAGAQVTPPPPVPTAPTPRGHEIIPRPIQREAHAVLPPPEIAATIDAFFKGLEANEVRKAYLGLLTGTRLITQEDDLNPFITKTQQAITLYGQLSDYEVYDTRAIGSRLLVTTYLSAQPVAPLRWRFIYYKADKKWTLINVVFDDSLSDLLE